MDHESEHGSHMHHFAHGFMGVLFLVLLMKTPLGRFCLLLTALYILW